MYLLRHHTTETVSQEEQRFRGALKRVGHIALRGQQRCTNLLTYGVNVVDKGDSRVGGRRVRGVDPDIRVPTVSHDSWVYATGCQIFRKGVSQPHVLLRSLIVTGSYGECGPWVTIKPVYSNKATRITVSSFSATGNLAKDTNSLNVELLVLWSVEYGQVGETLVYPYLARISSSCWRKRLALQFTQRRLCEFWFPKGYRCSLEGLIAICTERANFVDNRATSIPAIQSVFKESPNIAGGCCWGQIRDTDGLKRRGHDDNSTTFPAPWTVFSSSYKGM